MVTLEPTQVASQLWNYQRLSGIKVSCIMNFKKRLWLMKMIIRSDTFIKRLIIWFYWRAKNTHNNHLIHCRIWILFISILQPWLMHIFKAHSVSIQKNLLRTKFEIVTTQGLQTKALNVTFCSRQWFHNVVFVKIGVNLINFFLKAPIEGRDLNIRIVKTLL